MNICVALIEVNINK